GTFGKVKLGRNIFTNEKVRLILLHSASSPFQRSNTNRFSRILCTCNSITFYILQVAIKILKYKKVKTPAEKKLVEREKMVLQMLNHPNIVKLIKLLDDHERGCCYMVIEYVSGGELFDYIVSHGRLREKDARKF